MKIPHLLILSFFLFTIDMVAQVQQEIDNLIGSYTPYLLTNGCGQPVEPPYYQLADIEISSIENTETVRLNYSILYPDTTEMISEIVKVEEVADSIGTHFELSIIPFSFFVNVVHRTGLDSLILAKEEICAGCDCARRFYVSRETSTNINQVALNAWRIYPNPADSFIRIEKENDPVDRAVEITIFDSVGRIVYVKELFENKIQIPLMNISEGIYFLRLQEGSQIQTEKFIKLKN